MAERRFMPDRWVRLSATYYLDPRVMRVGADAELLFVRGLCFARQLRTDGHVSSEQLPLITSGIRRPAPAVRALVLSGLWDECADGYRVPKDTWERWQTTEGEIDERREADRIRKAQWRAKRREQELGDDETY